MLHLSQAFTIASSLPRNVKSSRISLTAPLYVEKMKMKQKKLILDSLGYLIYSAPLVDREKSNSFVSPFFSSSLSKSLFVHG